MAGDPGQKAGAAPPPGFEKISRSWDETQGAYSARILPGEYYVTQSDEIITTVLGSCISACLRNRHTGIGGMNHFMLPGASKNSSGQGTGKDFLATRYGVAAMEQLINDVIKLGSSRSDLEVKLFGGGEILNMGVNNVGKSNVDFVLDFVRAEEIRVVAEDLGGPHPRVVHFFPKTGKVMVKHLRSLHNKTVAAEEQAYQAKILKSTTNEVELF